LEEEVEGMQLKLPTLGNSRCVVLTACGELKGINADLKKWMADQGRMSAVIGQGKERRYLRVYFGGNSGNHLHIDLLRPSMLLSKPEPTDSLKDALKKLERFVGLEVVASFEGKFEVKIADLPSGGIIRSLLLESKTGNVEITVSGAQFTITGAPISEIRWLALSDEKIGLSLEAEPVKTTITEGYLVKALDILETGLDVFVLKGGK
jgi:hypothetical protein